MRCVLFSLLILLTAFRGMVGDAMAYGMTSGMMQRASHSMLATESVAPRIDSMPATGHFSSEKSTSVPCHEAADDADADSNSHTCSTCMVCHSPLAQLSTIVTSQSQQAQIYSTLQGSTWMSAELSRFQKPPVF